MKNNGEEDKTPGVMSNCRGRCRRTEGGGDVSEARWVRNRERERD